MKPRTKTLTKTVSWSADGNIDIDLPQDGPVAGLTIRLCGKIVLTDGGGGAAGTAKTGNSLPPFGALARLDIQRNPETKIAPLSDLRLIFFHHLRLILFPGKAPKRDFPSTGAASTGVAVFGEIFVPLGLPRAEDTYTDVRDFQSFKVTGRWQSTAALTRDAMFTSCTMTFSNHATDPFRLEVTPVEYVCAPGEAYKRKIEVGFREERFTIDQATWNPCRLNVGVGEQAPLVMAMNDDNSVAAAIPDAGRWQFGYGDQAPHVDEPPYAIQKQNADDYDIADASWPTSLYVQDELKFYGKGLAGVPIIGSKGDAPKINMHRGGTTPTATSQLRTITMITRPAE